jgi:hypothetical protein
MLRWTMAREGIRGMPCVSSSSNSVGGRFRRLVQVTAQTALIVGTVAAAEATEHSATLTVPGSALVFSGSGLQAPDDEGHFAIGVRLPQPSLRTAYCDNPYLIVGIGTLNKAESDLTDADHKIIARNAAYYARLLEAANRGTTVKLPVRNNPDYLKVTNGVIFAPYCILSIDQGAAP